MKRLILYMVFLLCLSGAMKGQTPTFPLPEVPQLLVTPTDRANYLAEHYWDRFDFSDPSLIGREEITEQGFVNFISIMPYVTEREKAFAVFARRMVSYPQMFTYLQEVSEHYLFDAFSPVYDEELYALLLKELLKLPKLSVVERERFRYQLGITMKNRVGKEATDFGFVLRSGKRMSLKDVKGDYVLLYLNDPECTACRKVKEDMQQSALIRRWMDSGKMTVLSVCIEGKTSGWEHIPAPEGWMDAYDADRRLLEEDWYDLRNLPAVYLLDADKKVLLKNATLQRLEEVLRTLK